MIIDLALDTTPLLTVTWHGADGQRSLRVSGELDVATAPDRRRRCRVRSGRGRSSRSILPISRSSTPPVFGSWSASCELSEALAESCYDSPARRSSVVLAVVGLDGMRFDQSMKGIPA